MTEFPKKNRQERTRTVDTDIARTTNAFDQGQILQTRKSEEPLEALIDRENPETQLEAKQLIEGLEKMLDELNPRDALVIRLRFGLLDHPSVAKLGISPDDPEDFTYERIGKLMGKDGSTVNQIEKKALLKLYNTKGRVLASRHLDASKEDIYRQQYRRYLRGGPRPRP